MNLSKAINKALADKEMSNTELASRMGVSCDQISRWKRDATIGLPRLESMAKALDMNVSQLIKLGE